MRLSLTKGYFGREGTGLGDSGLHCDFYLFLQNESDLIDPTLAVVFDSVDIYEIIFLIFCIRFKYPLWARS